MRLFVDSSQLAVFSLAKYLVSPALAPGALAPAALGALSRVAHRHVAALVHVSILQQRHDTACAGTDSVDLSAHAASYRPWASVAVDICSGVGEQNKACRKRDRRQGSAERDGDRI